MAEENELIVLDEEEVMLSTIDNPYNPHSQYDQWRRWDHERGYNTEEYIGRLILMEKAYDIDDEWLMNRTRAKVINEILENDDIGLYRLV